MPRIRTIKPEFFEDDKIGSLSPYGRLCFIGLWTLADDFGTLNKAPEVIRGQLFPFDYNDPELDIHRILQELENLGLIVRYGPNKRYIYIPNFHKHQQIDKPSPIRSAPPPEEFGIPVSPEYVEFVLKAQEYFAKSRKQAPQLISEKLQEALTMYQELKREEITQTFSDDVQKVSGNVQKFSEHVQKISLKEMELEMEQEKEPEKNKNNNTYTSTSVDCERYSSLTPDVKPFENHEVKTENTLSTLSAKQEETKDKTGTSPARRGNGKATDVPSCPHQEIVQLYNQKLPELPQVKKLSDTRKKLLRARWREVFTDESIAKAFLEGLPGTVDDGVYWFARFFEYVSQSDFLMGRIQTRSRDAPWQADFDWLIRPNNFLKVLEGRYHNNNQSQNFYDDIKAWLESKRG